MPASFRALAFYSTTVEPDHVRFAHTAIRFYEELATHEGFQFEATKDWSEMNDEALSSYEVVIWLNDFPKTESERSAFERYMEQGGSWLGIHVAGYNDRHTRWPWFVDLMGRAVFYTNNWPPLPAILTVDDREHPATRRLPEQYTAAVNEWYMWQPSPRFDPDVRVLVTLSPSNFQLGAKDILTGGDIPVVWTHTRFSMIYLNMGHDERALASDIQNRLFEDALLWLGRKETGQR